MSNKQQLSFLTTQTLITALKKACSELAENSSLQSGYSPCEVGWEGCKYEYCGEECNMMGKADCWLRCYVDEATEELLGGLEGEQ